jgi:glycosyltransferase involved in cell wall biosynthesis
VQRPELVSVIMPVRNGAVTLPESLDALAGQRYDGAWELIVADNGSDDGSAQLVRRWESRVPMLRVVDASAKRGASYARNVAARSASGDFLAFIDADDVADQAWLAAIATAAQEADLVGGRIELDLLNPAELRAFDAPPIELPVALDYLPFALSGNCGIWRSVFERLGGWNEEYVDCMDVEFSWRLQQAGYRVGYAPAAVVHYRLRRPMRSVARQFMVIGMAEAKLYRDFRTSGVPPSRNALKAWLWAGAQVPRALTSMAWRRNVLRRTARRVGRLRGSLRERVFFP